RLTRRYQERAAERLEAMARHLPSPASLLDPQRQRLDDVGDRLPRALGRRLAIAGGELAQAAGALRPRLIEDRIRNNGALIKAEMRDRKSTRLNSSHLGIS